MKGSFIHLTWMKEPFIVSGYLLGDAADPHLSSL